MRNKIYLAGFAAGGALAGALTLAVLAGAPQVSAREADDRAPETRVAPKCLDARDTGRFHVVDEKTLLIYDRSGNPYKLDIGGPCRSMDDMDQFGFEFFGGTQICRAHDAKLLRSQHGEQPVKCLINDIKSISREEADRLDPEN